MDLINRTPYDLDFSDLPVCSCRVEIMVKKIKMQWRGYFYHKRQFIRVSISKDLVENPSDFFPMRSEGYTGIKEPVFFGSPVEIIRFGYCHELKHYLDFFNNKRYKRPHVEANRFALKHYRADGIPRHG